VSETYQLVGGTVGVSCVGDAVQLDYAIPRDEYRVEVHDDGPNDLSVRFDNNGNESRVDVFCQGGTPVEDIRET
jgi:hypothetical protein